MSEPWRIQPTSPPSMAVLIDAWEELALSPASISRDRVDLIAERSLPSGLREYRAFLGATGLGPQPLPAGYTRLGTVRVGCGQMTVAHCHIGD